LTWLSKFAGLSENQLVSRIGSTVDELFDQIEAECGRISPKDLDSRFINLFLLKAD